MDCGRRQPVLNGRLRQSTRRCAADGDERVAIVVRDTGQGIAPDDLERLFLPFERLGLEGGAIEGAGAVPFCARATGDDWPSVTLDAGWCSAR